VSKKMGIVYWGNFKTGESDAKAVDWVPASDEEAKQYISQDVSAQSSYDVYRKMGKSIQQAMIAVLEAQITHARQDM
jgi:hypothetical protein